MQNIKLNDQICILPAFQDAGDSDFKWIAVSAPEKGKIDISPVIDNMSIAPVYVVKLEWIAAI